MGSNGPVPKRSQERRRRNKDSKPETAKVSGEVKVPKPDKGWHPIARRWFKSLAESGQAQFYEPSDWASAYLIAESMSRDLSPQFVAVTEKGESVYERIPLKGASLAAYLKAMSVLLVTEGDRRRARLEIERGATVELAPVSVMDGYRDALEG